MARGSEGGPTRRTLALNLELSHGRHGASARVELQERPEATAGARRIARVTLRGWIDAVAERRLEQALDDLAARGVDQVLLDCAELRHIDYRLAPGLVTALERFEARAAGIVVCGLSRHLRDLFRLAGCEPRVRCWPSSAELFDAPARSPEPSGEPAS
ncbi:MAG TPA: STAS domain-containing protein [Candidatus Eisenbacteria bacterium]|jgi:anti-anti-sigma factor